MFHMKRFLKLANLLDDAGLYEGAGVIDEWFSKKSNLEIEMEKEVEVSKDDDDKDEDKEETETKKKKLTLVFD